MDKNVAVPLQFDIGEDVLGKANEESFVIMDELGSGTDPTEGMGIAVAILE